MFKNKNYSKVLFEIILLSTLIFSWIILAGNNRLKNSIKMINGNKIGITPDTQKISSDLNMGKTIAPVFPDKKTLDKIENDSEITYMSIGIPSYITQADIKENDILKNLKLIGTNQVTPYDLFIEKILLVEGRKFTEKEIIQGKNVAIMSEEFVKRNKLKIGDTYYISISVAPFEYEEEDEHVHEEKDEHIHKEEDVKTITFPIKVIGVFKSNINTSIRQDSEESLFYINLLSSNMYIPNIFSKEINSKLLSKQIDFFPNEFKDVKDLYGKTITEKNKLLEHLEAFQTYEISLVPKNNYVSSDLKERLSTKLNKFPYIEAIYTSDRYDVYQILPVIILSVAIISFIVSIVYYFYKFTKYRKAKFFVKQLIFCSIISFSFGLLLSNIFSSFYINELSRFSSKYPNQENISVYNNLEKTILTTENILELRRIPLELSLLSSIFLIAVVITIAYILFRIHNYQSRKYVRLP